MSVVDVPTVFIIDDDSGVRESIQDLVESVALRAESFATAQQFLSSERRDVPSCLVLDVRLPGISGLDLQHELKRAGARISIIFISGQQDRFRWKPRSSEFRDLYLRSGKEHNRCRT